MLSQQPVHTWWVQEHWQRCLGDPTPRVGEGLDWFPGPVDDQLALILADSMSSKKALLKLAKECMAGKSHRDALVHLKAVLTEDKACYDAYV